MPKLTTTIFLALISLCTSGQKTGELFKKSGIMSLSSRLSYIPAKSFNSLVYTGKDSVADYLPRISSVQGFYISRTEVTNKEYREFVGYVRDSLAHRLLGHYKNGSDAIDWNRQIDWKDDRLDPIMNDADNRIFGRKEIDPAKFFYNIYFFGHEEKVDIYPDTLVWIRDFPYAYNEPLAKNYFSNASYDHYPVLGISLKQAMAFCEWKTGQINALLRQKSKGNSDVVVRLPTSAEWESAATDAKNTAGLFERHKNYNCNFGVITDGKGLRLKGFKDDGYFYTSPVKSFAPGPYGLYDMQGNVNEWTSTGREEIMHAEVQPDKQKTTFIVKGGGWQSPPFYLQPGVCQFYKADEANAWVGFRYVVSLAIKY